VGIASRGLDRRTFLKAGLAAAGGFAAPSLLGCSERRPPGAASGTWSNWSGGQVSKPRERLAPRDEADLIAGLRSARGSVRVTGASHSFSALCKTDDTLLTLDDLSGIVSHDAQKLQATVWAGTRVRNLGEPLWQIGQGLVNQGDIDPQSLGGACGTSTHGTGVALGSFSSTVRGVRLVTADGEVVEATPESEAEVFHAACTSLGALGILTQITLQNRPAYKLREREFIEDVRTVLDKIEAYMAKNRHFEFWAFYQTDGAIVKLLNETDDAPTPPQWLSLPVDTAVWAACEIAHGMPYLDGRMQWLLTKLHTDTDRVGRSFEIFPSARDVRFNEMEYELPAEKGPECVLEILETVRTSGLNTLFPVEYRTVAADDAWLSPFYERASASISIHQYHEVDYRPLFSVVEPIFWKHGGRPHWGKLHTLTARELAELYPKWDDFQRVRRRIDPQGRFLNSHLRTVLGEPA
jgi:FAD-linked oxidoreductase